MKRCALITAALLALSGPLVLARPQETIRAASELEVSGQFKAAARSLTEALQTTTLAAADRKQLEFELDRLERIKKDFPWTEETLFLELKKFVQDLSREEYESWVGEGRFESREIDGTRYFMVSSVSNLFWRYPELSPRRLPP